MATATLQEQFDHTLNGVRKQGKAAMDNASGACVYRDTEDNKCGVGHHIPDDLYTPAMEGRSLPYNKLVQDVVIYKLNRDYNLLLDLQAAHDNAAHKTRGIDNFLTVFEDQMKNLAIKYNLIYTEPTK